MEEKFTYLQLAYYKLKSISEYSHKNTTIFNILMLLSNNHLLKTSCRTK